jgi:hypothetical protein
MRGTQGQVTLKTVFPVSLYSLLYFCPFGTKHTAADFNITFISDGWQTAYIKRDGPATDHGS